MPRYNHLLALGFSVESNDPEGEDITAEQIYAGIKRRVDDLYFNGALGEVIEACTPPLDTYEVE